jgi:hypothetical protein
MLAMLCAARERGGEYVSIARAATCATRAADAADAARDTRAAAYAARAARAAADAAYAAYAARSSSSSADDAVEAARAAALAADDADAARAAARRDFDALRGLKLARRVLRSKPVPRSFFERPLWPEDVNAPMRWSHRISEWRRMLEGLGLADLYGFYSAMIEGGLIEWKAAKRRAKHWASKPKKAEQARDEGLTDGAVGATHETGKLRITFDPQAVHADDLVDFLAALNKLYQSTGGDELIIREGECGRFARAKVPL